MSNFRGVLGLFGVELDTILDTIFYLFCESISGRWENIFDWFGLEEVINNPADYLDSYWNKHQRFICQYETISITSKLIHAVSAK